MDRKEAQERFDDIRWCDKGAADDYRRLCLDLIAQLPEPETGDRQEVIKVLDEEAQKLVDPDCHILMHSRAYRAEKIRSAIAMLRAGTVPKPWVITDGSNNIGEHKFRCMKNGMPAWTLDPNEAIQFFRRADAEEFAREDEDAWRIVQIAPTPGKENGK